MCVPLVCPVLVAPLAPLIVGIVEDDDLPRSGSDDVVPMVEELVAEPPLKPPFAAPGVGEGEELEDELRRNKTKRDVVTGNRRWSEDIFNAVYS